MDLATVDKLLTTTRSVRKRLDLERPVEREIIMDCIEIALQAPTGSNAQGWHFMVVTDAEKKAQIADYYKQSWDVYSSQRVEPTSGQVAVKGQMKKVIGSAAYLAENMARIPVMIIPCVEGRVEKAPQWMQASVYGSILPAAWSLMLALRARGIGSSWTTLHLKYEKETSELLGIPENFTQAALLPIGYFTGADFKPAKRLPASELTSWDSWGN
ncbi:MAG: nitroreductase family protein [Anaerolineae bacterium]|nr:nitroreductase family protein [Anaerolineae bacterium]MDQ7036123.1 nitroreductase family protein [Anaerolineae bacterium]